MGIVTKGYNHKESQDLKTLDIFTPFGKISKHEHDLKIVKASEENIKKKEKFEEDKVRISLKASSYKANAKDDEINFNEDS